MEVQCSDSDKDQPKSKGESELAQYSFRHGTCANPPGKDLTAGITSRGKTQLLFFEHPFPSW